MTGLRFVDFLTLHVCLLFCRLHIRLLLGFYCASMSPSNWKVPFPIWLESSPMAQLQAWLWFHSYSSLGTRTIIPLLTEAWRQAGGGLACKGDIVTVFLAFRNPWKFWGRAEVWLSQASCVCSLLPFPVLGLDPRQQLWRCDGHLPPFVSPSSPSAPCVHKSFLGSVAIRWLLSDFCLM